MNNWISIKDELPKEDINYITTLKSGEVTMSSYSVYSEYFCCHVDCIEHEVTHWMELPNPPSINEEE